MFDEMREPRSSWLLIGRPHPVPNHMGHDRKTVIGDHHYLKAIVKREAVYLLIEDHRRDLSPDRCCLRKRDRLSNHRQGDGG